MEPLSLHEWHQGLGAKFMVVNGAEVVANYGDTMAEYIALTQSAAVLDLSFRSRICLTGSDRGRFLHGQVTNDVKRLRTGEGCYATLITAKGRMESDLNIFALAEEMLLDFEPGLTKAISERLERYVIADDVQIVDVAPHYGLLSVQGPKTVAGLVEAGISEPLPEQPFNFVKLNETPFGELYVMNQPRLATAGFDLFAPVATLRELADKLLSGATSVGGRPCGWEAFELARIEAGIPRFGADMDETTIPLEAGLEKRAISFSKGCYIGQEIISRIQTYGEVAKVLRGLQLADDLPQLPVKGDKLRQDHKEAGYITSAICSPARKVNWALGYVRKGMNQIGTELTLQTERGESRCRIVELSFTPTSIEAHGSALPKLSE